MKRDDVLKTAESLINGDRAEEYGDARENFDRIATMWRAYTGYDITKEDVGPMMVLLKVARLATGQKDDSFVDIAGYAALGAEMNHRSKKQELSEALDDIVSGPSEPEIEDDGCYTHMKGRPMTDQQFWAALVANFKRDLPDIIAGKKR
jgi:hypothetical protein